ncbi:MAG: ABC transporter ATP-binding protein [Capnocytophaga sp.]|nr:ABC transporter ATP-binding protein [Capnocytophaga sp.]
MTKDKQNTTNFNIFKQLFQYIKPYRWLFGLVAFVAVFLSGIGAWRAYLSKIIIDEYIVPKDYNGLLLISLAMVGLLVAEILAQISFSYYSGWLGQSVIYDIRTKLFNKMLHFKMKYYDNSSVGILVTRAVNDMERIGEIFSAGLFEIISDVLKMLVIMGLMLWVDWRLALLSFVTLPIIIYATNWFQKATKVAFTEVRKQVGLLNSFVQERISGMKIVQLFGRENIEYQKFSEINKKHERAWLRNIMQNSIYFPIGEILTSVATALVVWYGGLQSVSTDASDLGTIFMFIQLIQSLFRPLRHIADKFNTLQMGMVATSRVFHIMDTSAEEKEVDNGVLEKEISGNIQFQKVHFGYKPEEEILHGISFEAQKGQTIAIVGATGAGKSTIIHLINRFYDLQQGEILVDGTNILDFNLENYRKQIAVVLQDVFLFADTIYNNITLGNSEISLEEVEKAAKEIGIHDFINKLPDGYQYNVKERGATLSAGQRQLISFLRAYVHKPKILILDEATSSVDSHSEKLLQEATEKITKGRTSLVIAHRLATIRRADKIIVLDKGNIVEEGTHESLLQIENGYYKNLYEIQFAIQDKN